MPLTLNYLGSWRFVTMALKEHNYSDYNLENPPGVFADWMAVNLSVAKPFQINKNNFIVAQLSGGYDHFGDKAAKGVQQDIHRSLGIDYKIYNYNNQINTENYFCGRRVRFCSFCDSRLPIKEFAWLF